MQVVFLLKKVENNTVYKSDQDLINDFYTKKKTEMNENNRLPYLFGR